MHEQYVKENLHFGGLCMIKIVRRNEAPVLSRPPVRIAAGTVHV